MERIALILLASGASERFGQQDKLLASFRGQPLSAHAAKLYRSRQNVCRIAVAPSGATELHDLLDSYAWSLTFNQAPEQGQSSSLRIGIQAAQALSVDAVLICLADMPFITDEHLDQITSKLQHHTAVMSVSGRTPMPPAAFKRDVFDQLTTLSGDKGARSVFTLLTNTATVPLSAERAIDIDTPEALSALNKGQFANE